MRITLISRGVGAAAVLVMLTGGAAGCGNDDGSGVTQLESECGSGSGSHASGSGSHASGSGSKTKAASGSGSHASGSGSASSGSVKC